MSYFNFEEDYERDTIKLKVVKIIANIMAKKYREYIYYGKVYYKYGDKKYYFTNDLGQYDDTSKGRSNMEAFFNSLNAMEAFLNSLNELKELDISNYSKDIHYKIAVIMINIKGNSPTELSKEPLIDRNGDLTYNPTVGVIRHKLYDAVFDDVLEDVKKEQKEKLGGKRISKGKSNKVAKKPVVSQKKQSVYKEIFGKQMKIYKMPDSRKEYVKYKGELHPISEYKSLMKQKAMAKAKTKK